MASAWRRVAPLLFLVGGASTPHLAWGQPASASDARSLKAQADEAMVNLEYAEALRLYDEVYAVTKDPALHYNRSRALAALRRFPEALAMLESFAREAKPELRQRVPKLEQFLDEARQRVHVLTVRVRPAGSTVRLDDTVVGVAPIEERAVNAGRVRLRVTADGHQPIDRDLELDGASASTLDLTLIPRDHTATLVVRSPVAGSVVFVDGRRRGQVPVEVRLPPGQHTVRLTRDGYDDADRAVALDVAERETIDVGLDETPGIAERWWFWTSVGAVVVTGAAIGIGVALSTERDPGRGDIDPGRIPVAPSGLALPF